MAYYFRRSVLPSRLVTRQVMFSQQQKFAIRNSKPVLFQSSLLRSYTNSTFPPPSPQDSTSSYKFAKAIAKRLRAVIIWKLVVAGVIGGISVDLLYAWFLSSRNKRLLNNTMEKGTRPIVEKENKLVPRPDIVERLKIILQPDEEESSYYVVCGEHGTGKTTLTRIASREVGQGVIYVEVPSDTEDIEKFGIAFGESLNFAFEEHISISTQLMKKILGDTNVKVDEHLKWKRAFEAFKHAGAVYKAKHNKLPVIVYDNVNGLVNINPKVLETLQNDAKMCADHQEYIAVFVTSEGSIPRRMKSRSVWSRAEIPIEIGDLSEEDSMKYLTEKRMIDKTEAEKLYDLVGGRIVVLKKVAKRFKKGLKFEAIKKEILDEVEMNFKAAQLLPKQLHYEAGKKAIKALLKSKELKFKTFMEFFDNYEEADKVLEANVFSYHPEKHTVTFQSRSVESYIREEAGIFIK